MGEGQAWKEGRTRPGMRVKAFTAKSCPVSDSKPQHGASQVCSSYLTDAGSRSPIEQAGLWVRGQMSPSEETSSLLASSIGCSGFHFVPVFQWWVRLGPQNSYLKDFTREIVVFLKKKPFLFPVKHSMFNVLFEELSSKAFDISYAPFYFT